MIKKSSIAQLLFLMASCYIIAPWFFEKRFLFNELLAASGFCLLAYHRFKVSKDSISYHIMFLLGWCVVHIITSLFRADNAYYYLRNLVIVYSIFCYFLGFFLLPYLRVYLQKARVPLKYYIGLFLLIPLPRLFFERFGVSALFPALLRKIPDKLLLPLMIGLNIIYAISYKSFTTFVLAAFYILLLVSPGYKFFKQFAFLLFACFVVFFILIKPNLDIIALHYDYYDTIAIHEVMNSNVLLSIDGNSTWRLVLWKEVIVDNFPSNIFGVGFGTPMIKYFPVEDFSKIPSLPYVIGAHNSFVYLFGRLGIIYLLVIAIIYRKIFKEYFYYKSIYYQNKKILVFWSFFAISIIALFNPVLESPIFSGAYWLILGLLARCIQIRIKETKPAFSA
ncbi:MAG: hypothetical protein WKF89_04445 [Chitinophagaceae bacterium]